MHMTQGPTKKIATPVTTFLPSSLPVSATAYPGPTSSTPAIESLLRAAAV
jgi:hypothetical protein